MSEYVPAALRDLVQKRARGRCEYCLIHEDDTFACHEVDHVIAIKHRGKTIEENLAWSCVVCNRLKGSDIASIDVETGGIMRLFNPRLDDWNKHFRLEGSLIIPLTPEGRVTEYILKFNLPSCIRDRRDLIDEGRYPG